MQLRLSRLFPCTVTLLVASPGRFVPWRCIDALLARVRVLPSMTHAGCACARFNSVRSEVPQMHLCIRFGLALHFVSQPDRLD